MDTSQKILEASIKVFTEKGYLGSTTKEIAETAAVSEMTLFRKFKSKKNLFESMIQSTLEHKLNSFLNIDFDIKFAEFIRKLLHNLLINLSKNIGLIRMIIQESIQGRIPENLNYIDLISKKIKVTLNSYLKLHAEISNTGLDIIISGMLLQYAVMTPKINYHLLSDSDQKDYIERILSQLKL